MRGLVDSRVADNNASVYAVEIKTVQQQARNSIRALDVAQVFVPARVIGNGSARLVELPPAGQGPGWNRGRVKTVRDFPAIGHAVAVSVRVQGIRSILVFLKIGQSIVVRVLRRVVCKGIEPVRDFPAIGHAVAIRVGIMGVCAVQVFLEVGQAVGVRVQPGVIGQGIEAVRDFPAIGHAVVVRIGVQGVGPMRQLIAVAQAVVIRIRIARIGSADDSLIVIGKAVGVAIHFLVRSARLNFLRSVQAVAVRINIHQAFVNCDRARAPRHFKANGFGIAREGNIQPLKSDCVAACHEVPEQVCRKIHLVAVEKIDVQTRPAYVVVEHVQNRVIAQDIAVDRDAQASDVICLRCGHIPGRAIAIRLRVRDPLATRLADALYPCRKHVYVKIVGREFRIAELHIRTGDRFVKIILEPVPVSVACERICASGGLGRVVERVRVVIQGAVRGVCWIKPEEQLVPIRHAVGIGVGFALGADNNNRQAEE